RLAWDPAGTALSGVLRQLVTLGYRPYLAGGQAREAERRRERNRDLIRIGIAGLGSMQAMMLAEALYLDFGNTMPLPTRDFFRWITFLVSTPVVFYAGWPFIEGAWRELRQRRLGMDLLIAGSTLLAWGASVFETMRGGDHVWYDAAVLFVFLLLAAGRVGGRRCRLRRGGRGGAGRRRAAGGCAVRGSTADRRAAPGGQGHRRAGVCRHGLSRAAGPPAGHRDRQRDTAVAAHPAGR